MEGKGIEGGCTKTTSRMHTPTCSAGCCCVQESIHQSQAWFMACLSHAPGMARKMAEHVRGCPDYARQLHTVYLANDILLKSCASLRLFWP